MLEQTHNKRKRI